MRRQSPRIQVGDKIRCEDAETAIRLVVLDLSFDGLAVEAPTPAKAGSVRHLYFRSLDGSWQGLISVRVLGCRRHSEGGIFDWHCTFDHLNQPAMPSLVAQLLAEVASASELP